MINVNANVTQLLGKINANPAGAVQNKVAEQPDKAEFANTIKAVENYISKVDDMQGDSNIAIKDLLAGKTENISTVVSAMAKADMSFKLLVGVRNKLIDAYKRTMNMQV